LPETISRNALAERAQTRASRARAGHEQHAVKLEFTIPAPLEEIERRAIEATLEHTGGDKTRAARALGIGRKTLYRKLLEYKNSDE
jgi:DNA-binding NtrC family response regulator